MLTDPTEHLRMLCDHLASFWRLLGRGDGGQYVRTTADAIGRITGEG